MKSDSLCLKLLYAESEAEVQGIIDSDATLSDPENWHPLNGEKSNFNIVTNQASTAGKAATELKTNMVDAILLKRAAEEGIDPRGADAPGSMYEAVDTFLGNIQGGKLTNADEAWLRKFAAENLIVGTTGSDNSKRKHSGEWPCYTFVDNGEGQHPKDFEDTFLALKNSEKQAVPFTQGKYSMGSSGVLNYCGRNWFKLTISRKFDRSGDWGWTLIRRQPNGTVPVAEYFKPKTGMPAFAAESLHPFRKLDGTRYEGVSLEAGTIVKLYDYNIGEDLRSFRGARDAFVENLTETILPFRLMDFRYAKGGTTKGSGEPDERPFYGMEYLLLRTHAGEVTGDENGDKKPLASGKIEVGVVMDPEIGKISITAIPLSLDVRRERKPGWLYRSNRRIFHSINGQVQFKQSRRELSNWGFSAIKDRVVLVVDASELAPDKAALIWKADREQINLTAYGQRYLDLVAELVKTSAPLKAWRDKVVKEELARIQTEEAGDLFQKLLDTDTSIADILTDTDPKLSIPVVAEPDIGEYKGQYSPKFLEITRPKSGQVLDVPINRAATVTAETDVENGYLTRSKNKGKLVISDETVRANFSISPMLYEGKLTVFFKVAGKALKVGDTFEFELGLVDPAMPEPIAKPVQIRITAEVEKSKPKPKPKPDPKDEEPKPKFGLPKCVLLTHDGREIEGFNCEPWPADYDKSEGGYVKELGDQKVYYVNFDNPHHWRLRKKATGYGRDVVSQKYIMGMRLLMLGFENALEARKKKDEKGKQLVDEFEDDFREIASRGAAQIGLLLSEVLPSVMKLSSGDNGG